MFVQLATLYTVLTTRTLSIAKSRHLVKHQPGMSKPAHICKVYRCSVTPTRLLLFPPEEEVSNTILRKYEAYSDRFMRVTFTDEVDRVMVSAQRIEFYAVLTPNTLDQPHRQDGRPRKRSGWDFRQSSKGSSKWVADCRAQICLSGC